MSYLPISTESTYAKIEHDMSEQAYRSAMGMSQSSLKEFMRSPAHYLASTEKVNEPTPAMNFGSAFHIEMSDGAGRQFYAVKKKMDGRTKEGKLYNEQFAIDNEGKIIIDEKEEAKILAMKLSILTHKTAGVLAKNLTHKELPVFGEISIDGIKVRLKGLIDGYDENSGVIVDWKSCEDASPKGFWKAIRDRDYWLQTVQYPWLLLNAGKKVTDFIFVCVEKEPPYAVGVYRISALQFQDNYKRWLDLVTRFSVCNSTGNYPAYSEEVVDLVL